MMTDYYFAKDLLNTKKKDDKEEDKDKIKEELKKKKEIIKEFSKKDCGRQLMAIYVDVYGNEFKEVIKVK